MNIDSNKLLTMSETKRIRIIEDYLIILTSKNLTPKTQSFYISVIKSLLTFYRKQVKLSIKIHGVNTTTTLKNEKIPEPEQVKELLSRLTPRTKTTAALIAFAGIRFETQASLQLEDFLDLLLNR